VIAGESIVSIPMRKAFSTEDERTPAWLDN